MSFGEVIAGFDPAVENLIVSEMVGDWFDRFCVENDRVVGNEHLLEDMGIQLLGMQREQWPPWSHFQ